jgi:hypothetical protein
MKTYHIYNGPSEGYPPVHVVQAAAFVIKNGVYIFLGEDLEQKLHAIAVTPGLLIKTAVGGTTNP